VFRPHPLELRILLLVLHSIQRPRHIPAGEARPLVSFDMARNHPWECAFKPQLSSSVLRTLNSPWTATGENRLFALVIYRAVSFPFYLRMSSTSNAPNSESCLCLSNHLSSTSTLAFIRHSKSPTAPSRNLHRLWRIPLFDLVLALPPCGPSPTSLSQLAPYASGRVSDPTEEFLGEYEGLANSCGLTDR